MSEYHGKWHDCCPVCFFPDRLVLETMDTICVCCGIRFGEDDDLMTLEELRENWVKQGCSWFDPRCGPPADWDARKQMEGGRSVPRGR